MECRKREERTFFGSSVFDVRKDLALKEKVVAEEENLQDFEGDKRRES